MPVAFAPLAKLKLLPLLDAQSPQSKSLVDGIKQQSAARATLTRMQEATRLWTNKLPPGEVPIALEQSTALESGYLPFLKPVWWRLRKILRTRYNFAAHTVKPRWSQILTALDQEYKAAAALAQLEQVKRSEFGIEEPIEELAQQIQQTLTWLDGVPQGVQSLHQSLLPSEDASHVVGQLVDAGVIAKRLQSVCSAFLEEFENTSLVDLRQNLKTIEGAIPMLPDFLYCLGQLVNCRPHWPGRFVPCRWTPPVWKRLLWGAASMTCCDPTECSTNSTATTRDGHVSRLAAVAQRWQECNAETVLEKSAPSVPGAHPPGIAVGGGPICGTKGIQSVLQPWPPRTGT